MKRDSAIVIGALNGRNGTDPPISLPDDQAVEMLNVDRYDGLMGRKRPGTAGVTDTGGTAFSSGMQTLVRHVPGSDETAAELWGIDGAATPIVKRMTGGTSFANVTVVDAIATNPQAVVCASLNGKLFAAYDSAVDRLHVYDPASANLRRVGIDPGSSAPTVANTGVGAYAATARYYRVRFIQIAGSPSQTTRRSEATPSVSFTPSGAGTAARVTRPAAPGESETHWELETSIDNATWTVVYGQNGTTQTGGLGASQAIANTTLDDTATIAAHASYTGSDAAGLYSLFPSVKVLIQDGNRLLGAGAWESSGATSAGRNSRVWFTPVLGSLDRGDDERIVNQTTQKNWVDLNENDGGGLSALGGPLNGLIYAFKPRQIWRLTPTGDVTTPYLPKKLIDGIGCVAHKSVAMGTDEAGRPALYFLSHLGAYRIGANGLQYLWRDNEDLTINLAASTVISQSIYYTDLHQWWLWIATGSSNDPDTLMVFDPLLGEVDSRNRVRKGWFRWTGNIAGARCACLMSATLGASMSRDLKPYLGRSSGTAIQKANTGTDDNGTTYQSYVKTKPLSVAPLGTNGGITDAQLLAKVASGVTITLTLDRDYGLETRTSAVLLTASASETRTLKKFEASAMSGAGTIQAQVGDASAVSNSWELDALVLPTTTQERR